VCACVCVCLNWYLYGVQCSIQRQKTQKRQKTKESHFAAFIVLLALFGSGLVIVRL